MSRSRVLVPWLAGTIAAAGVLATAAVSGQAPDPRAFAIRNARIVPVSGPAIDQGTVVVSGGLITAVGATVQAPPDAWVIDGKGLTVYPGLIDTLTDLGLTQAGAAAGSAAARAGGGGGGRPGGGGAAPPTPRATGPRDRPASTPWLQAADDVRADDRRIESWRNAGFTTALTAPKTGLFPGQSALINLAGDRPGDLVVASPVTLQVNLQPAGGFGGGFPGSLMGGIAYVRQVFIDVQHDAATRARYDTAPRGVERPEYDRTIRTIAEAQAANRPVMLPASTAVQIARALDLAQELKLRPILYGATEGYEAADRLAARKAPVLVSLKWPVKDPDGDPDAEDLLDVLRVRDRAPSTPAALQKAGVTFAFYSDGVEPEDLLAHARRAVQAGLPSDAAVKALTLDAAEILGVANRLGSIETGKIANLVVTDGDLFGEKTKVKLVFVDGRKFEVRESSRDDRDRGRNRTPAPTSMTGKWTVTYTTPQGAQTGAADLMMAPDGTLSGTITGHLGTTTVTSGSLTGSQFTFTTTVPTSSGPTAVTFTGTLDGNSIKGTFSAGTFNGEFTGTRPGSATSELDDESR